MQADERRKQQAIVEEQKRQAARDYEESKHEYIDLNNYEGELNAEIGDLRGDTTKLLMNIKDLDREINNQE